MHDAAYLETVADCCRMESNLCAMLLEMRHSPGKRCAEPRRQSVWIRVEGYHHS